ncbi:hypothetical protein AYO44_16370 [Planctomycetaceae bacterium SCGC AG-212-F19]|nr:hypothetical protein AYO44_16370 [Planctomycetaceae bacterium SCGC AG-212-F19]
MTEGEWLTGWKYGQMYDVIRKKDSTRQVRLFMVACCSLKAADFFDPRIPLALAMAERCADDPPSETEISSCWNALLVLPYQELCQNGSGGETARVIVDVHRLLDNWWDGPHYQNASHALAHAEFLSLRDEPARIFTGGNGTAAEMCARAIDSADALSSGKELEEDEQDGGVDTSIRREIANLVRDIFGNPFRPVTIEPAWRTSTVTSLAQGIYDQRAFDRLPILADALEDAGCSNANVLNHCRGGGEHVRGCWVVDLVLGKE